MLSGPGFASFKSAKKTMPGGFDDLLERPASIVAPVAPVAIHSM